MKVFVVLLEVFLFCLSMYVSNPTRPEITWDELEQRSEPDEAGKKAAPDFHYMQDLIHQYNLGQMPSKKSVPEQPMCKLSVELGCELDSWWNWGFRLPCRNLFWRVDMNHSGVEKPIVFCPVHLLARYHLKFVPVHFVPDWFAPSQKALVELRKSSFLRPWISNFCLDRKHLFRCSSCRGCLPFGCCKPSYTRFRVYVSIQLLR